VKRTNRLVLELSREPFYFLLSGYSGFILEIMIRIIKIGAQQSAAGPYCALTELGAVTSIFRPYKMPVIQKGANDGGYYQNPYYTVAYTSFK
jgi:hypothetical protein